jgi:hypothetical protein
MKQADNFSPSKWLVENKITFQSKLNENKSHTASSLLKMFKEKDLVNDRREYDEEDLMKAYPGLSKNEAKKLVNMLSNLNENQLNEESHSPDKMLELVKMYVNNFYDGGYDSAEIALEKIDKILNGDLDDYDKAFLKGEEDNY